MPPFSRKKRLAHKTSIASRSAAENNQSTASFPAQPTQFKRNSPIQRQGNNIEQSFIDDVWNFVQDKTGTASYHQPSKFEKDLKLAQKKLKEVKEPIDKAIKLLDKAESMASPGKKAKITSAKNKLSGLSGKLGKVESKITDVETILRVVRIFNGVRVSDPAKDPAQFALFMDLAFKEGGEMLGKSPHPVLGELGKFLKAGGESGFFMNMYGALDPGERYKHSERVGVGIQNEKELRDAAMSKGMDGIEEIKGTKNLNRR